ncbi:MAG: hypothetical protein M3Q56_01695 [Bacteroidota bacterium]|nr:hypothetical protein [Bacteroidota bacterium]
MVENKSNQNLKALVVVAILGLLGLNVYQFVNNRSLQKDNLMKETELTDLEKTKTELDKQYQESVDELNDMKTNNVELNSLIDSQKEELRIQKDKIGSLLRDSKNLTLAKREIDGMKSKVQEYVAEITRLKQENEQLTASNESLTVEKENLNREVQTKTAENQQLSEVKTNLTAQNEQIAKERSLLSKKVNRASSIQVNKIKTEAFEERDGKKPNEVSRAKNANYIQVCFNTSNNPNADAGNEVFHVRVLDPIGGTQAMESEGSGVFVSETTGDQVRYSTVAETRYANDVKQVCGKWKNPNGFQEGVYQVEIYNKGYLVGTSSIKLK